MRIALVTTTYLPRINGVAVSVDTFAHSFRKLGHEVVIVAPEFPEHNETEPDVVRIKSHYVFFDPEDRLPNPYLPSSRKKIEREILSRRFDIIHTQTPFLLDIDAIRWGKKMNCPLVHTYHTLFESYVHYVSFVPRPFMLLLTRVISRWYCHKMDLVVTPSTQMKKVLELYKVQTQMEVIPTGYKAEIFKPVPVGDFRKRHNIEPDVPVLLFAGRVAHEKNIPFLFKVLKQVHRRHPGAILFIAGDGPARNELIALAEKEGLTAHVRFPGYFSQPDLATCYAAANIFVFASVTETQGLVVIEAMAVGTPVVAVGEMGIAEVMAPQKGGYMVRLDVDEFSRRALDLLDNPALLEAKHREALTYSGKWSAEVMAKKMLACYQEIIDARKS